MNPESLPTIIPTWTQLTDEIPYLTRNVPSALRKLFEKAEAIYGDTLTYSAPTVAFIQEFSKSSTQGANAIIFVFKETQQLAEIYMINIWKSGKNFSQYVVDFMKAAYPLLQEWNLQLWADVPSPSGVGTTKGKVGETKESIEYIDGLFRFLRSKSEAVTYREKYKELTKVGAEAFQQIEKELRKPVAPMISSTR